MTVLYNTANKQQVAERKNSHTMRGVHLTATILHKPGLQHSKLAIRSSIYTKVGTASQVWVNGLVSREEWENIAQDIHKLEMISDVTSNVFSADRDQVKGGVLVAAPLVPHLCGEVIIHRGLFLDGRIFHGGQGS